MYPDPADHCDTITVLPPGHPLETADDGEQICISADTALILTLQPPLEMLRRMSGCARTVLRHNRARH